MAMKCKFVSMFVDEPKDSFFGGGGGVAQASNSYFVGCGGGVLEGMHMRSLN